MKYYMKYVPHQAKNISLKFYSACPIQNFSAITSERSS